MSIKAQRILRDAVAAPRDVTIGPHKHERSLIVRRDAVIIDIDDRQRHPAKAAALTNSPVGFDVPSKASSTKPRPNRSSVERPSESQACGAREPGRADGV